jgi:GWxTD domain-containing protein
MHARPELSLWAARGVARPAAVALFGLLIIGTAAPSAGQKLDKAAQTWLKQYRMLVLPDEVKVLEQIRDPADIAEFDRVFWARRNPAPAGSENPYKTAIDKARATADARFSDPGRKGSQTGCGQVFMLLGDPDEVLGLEIRTTFEDRPVRGADAWRRPEPAGRNATRDGARRPEIWTYKSNAERTFKMPRGDLRLQFDSGCEFEEGARVMDELSQVAARLVVHPEVQYEFVANGRLRPLAAAIPPPSKAAVLLDQPRSDFPLIFEVKLQMPGQNGGYSAGILRGEAGALPAQQVTAGKSVVVNVVARAVPPSGSPIDIPERRVDAVAGADGSFQTSYGLVLSPGTYDVSLAVVEPAGGRGAVAKVAIDVPNYSSGEMIVSPLMALAGSDSLGIAEGVDPFAAFIASGEHLFPRPGNVLAPTDTLRLLTLIHNAAVSPETKKASLRVAFTVLKDGKLFAKGSEQAFDTAGAAASVGPIPLTGFTPGQYVAHVEINDDVARTHLVRETPFVVSASGPGR